MSRARSLLALSFVTLAAVSCGNACGKDKGLPKGRLDGLAKVAVDVVPADTGLMGGLNWGSLKESKLYDKLLDAVKKEKEMKRRLDALDRACGVDLTRELDSMVFSSAADLDEKKAIAFVKGNWDKAKADECIVGYWKDQFLLDVRPVDDAPLAAYEIQIAADPAAPPAPDAKEPSKPARLYSWWPSGDTVVLAPKNIRNREFLADVVAKKTTVADNKAFGELLARVDTTRTFWLATGASSGLKSAFQTAIEGLEADPQGLFVSVDLRDGLDATIGIRFAADKEATAIAKKGQQELKAAQKDEDWGKYLQGVTIKATGKDVVVTIKLDEALLEELVTAFEGYLPSLGKLVKEQLGG